MRNNRLLKNTLWIAITELGLLKGGLFLMELVLTAVLSAVSMSDYWFLFF